MKSKKVGFVSVNAYIETFPEEVQKMLLELRTIIQAAAPGAEEKIAYQMPAFALNGNLVLFAAWKKHIGFYGTSNAIQAALKDELSSYAGPKGSLKFPIGKPLPVELISKIVELRVAENLRDAEIKPDKKNTQAVST